VCHLCNRAFTQREQLKTHCRLVHKIKLPPKQLADSLPDPLDSFPQGPPEPALQNQGPAELDRQGPPALHSPHPLGLGSPELQIPGPLESHIHGRLEPQIHGPPGSQILPTLSGADIQSPLANSSTWEPGSRIQVPLATSNTCTWEPVACATPSLHQSQGVQEQISAADDYTAFHTSRTGVNIPESSTKMYKGFDYIA
jgi:hypothetical protein